MSVQARQQPPLTDGVTPMPPLAHALDCPRPLQPPPHDRQTVLCAQLKAGEVHASAAVATELLKPAQPAELQVLGYTLLQHLVGAALAVERQ